MKLKALLLTLLLPAHAMGGELIKNPDALGLSLKGGNVKLQQSVKGKILQIRKTSPYGVERKPQDKRKFNNVNNAYKQLTNKIKANQND